MKEKCKQQQQQQNKQTNKQTKTKSEKSQGNRSYSERVRAKWFCCAFKLDRYR